MALLPYQFGITYGFSALQISLCYIAPGVGSLISAFVRGRVIDSRFRYYAKKLNVPIEKNRRTDLTDFPIERARIEVAIPTIIVSILTIIGFGWTVEYKTNLAGPLIFLFAFGFATTASVNCILVLMIDLYPKQAGTVTASANIVRCWLGAASTAYVVPLINAIGVGWTCTVFAGMMLVSMPLLFYTMKSGPRWRRENKERAERKAAEKAARGDVGGEKGIGPAGTAAVA